MLIFRHVLLFVILCLPEGGKNITFTASAAAAAAPRQERSVQAFYHKNSVPLTV